MHDRSSSRKLTFHFLSKGPEFEEPTKDPPLIGPLRSQAKVLTFAVNRYRWIVRLSPEFKYCAIIVRTVQ